MYPFSPVRECLFLKWSGESSLRPQVCRGKVRMPTLSSKVRPFTTNFSTCPFSIPINKIKIAAAPYPFLIPPIIPPQPPLYPPSPFGAIAGGCQRQQIRKAMEGRSEKDKSELSSNDSSTYSYKSVKLGVYSKGRLKSLSSTSIKLSRESREKMLASMSKKVKINNIQVLSKDKRMSDPYDYKEDLTVSCFPQLSSAKHHPPPLKNYLEYEHLARHDPSLAKFVEQVHPMRGERLACFEENCEVRRKWIRNIIFYEKEIKNLYLLKERRPPLAQDISSQIDKDVSRTFSQSIVTKIKLNLVQSDIEKYNLVEVLRSVLKLYASHDPQVGYVQGMNLVAAPIVFHMKEVNSSFIYFKEVMNYGKLRLFFLDNFDNIKHEVREKFKKLLRFYNTELYDYFELCEVDYTVFVPYYFTLFSSFVEIQYMHIVINEFMRCGISFLHKFFLVLLLFLKERIMEDREIDGVMTKLGASYIKSLNVNWKTLLALTEHINFT